MCRVKLSDFGLARKIGQREKIQDQAGSLPYMAPEVIRGSYDTGCDMWGVGACIYLLVCNVHWWEDMEYEKLEVADLNTFIVDSILEREVHFNLPNWEMHPAEFKELIQSLLSKEAALRPKARKLVKNKWMRTHGKSAVEFGDCCCSEGACWLQKVEWGFPSGEPAEKMDAIEANLARTFIRPRRFEVATMVEEAEAPAAGGSKQEKVQCFGRKKTAVAVALVRTGSGQATGVSSLAV
eukprot:s286_g1.t1